MSDRVPVVMLDPTGGAPGQIPTINAAGTALVYADAPAGGGGGGGTFVGCKAKRTTTQSVPTAAATAVQFNDTDDYDTNSIHDPATNNTRFTVPTGKGGVWKFTASVEWSGTSTTGNRFIQWQKNGTGLSSRDGIQRANATAGAGASSILTSTVDLELAAGDYVEVLAYQNSGGNLDVLQAAASAFLVGSASGGGSSSLTVQDENANVGTAVSQIDFQGAGVTVTPGTGEVVVTIPGGGAAAAHEDQSLVVAGADAKLATERRWAFGLPAQTTPVLVLDDDGTHFPINDGVDYFSIFNAAEVLGTPLDAWYGYAASHDDDSIWLLTAPDPLGPWTWRQAVVTTTSSALLSGHVSSPHVIVRNGTIILTYHGHDAAGAQPTVLATSTDGVAFTEQASVAFPLATNALRFYSRSTSYVRIIDAGYCLAAVFQANRAENNQQAGAPTTAVGWATSEPDDGLTWRIARRPLITQEPPGDGPFSPALIRLHGQWVILAMDWEANTIHGWVSDRLEPGSFVHVGPLVTSIPAGMTRIYHPEAIMHDGKLVIFFTADTGASNGGKIYATTIAWDGVSV